MSSKHQPTASQVGQQGKFMDAQLVPQPSAHPFWSRPSFHWFLLLTVAQTTAVSAQQLPCYVRVVLIWQSFDGHWYIPSPSFLCPHLVKFFCSSVCWTLPRLTHHEAVEHEQATTVQGCGQWASCWSTFNYCHAWLTIINTYSRLLSVVIRHGHR